MMLMERSCDYPELRDSLKGRSVVIWACSTCASLCNGIGSKQSVQSLSERLRSDGVDVKDTVSTGATCLMNRVRTMDDVPDADVILALTCDMGAANIGRATGRVVMNPIVTIGRGYLDDDGVPHHPDGSLLSPKSPPF